MFTKPKVYNWIGSDATNQYWDDNQNWAEGEVPDQKEAIVIFENSVKHDTKILLRRDIHLAQMWFNEQHSLTFGSEAPESLLSEQGPKFLFETSNQFSILLVDANNRGMHTYSPWILHSCIFGQRSRVIPGSILTDDFTTTIHIDGNLGNYKDPERASLQVFGRLIFQLNGANSFKGPVVVHNEGLIRAMVDGAIPDGSPISLEGGAKIFAADGVRIKAKTLRVDGLALDPGIYCSDSQGFSKAAEDLARATNLNVRTLSNLEGTGVVLVTV